MSHAALYLHPKHTTDAKASAFRNSQPTLDIFVNGFQVCIFVDEADRERAAKIAELLNQVFEYNPPHTEIEPRPVDDHGYAIPF